MTTIENLSVQQNFTEKKDNKSDSNVDENLNVNIICS